MNKRKCAHGYELDSRGFHIHKPIAETAIPEKSWTELIEEAKKLGMFPTTVEPKTQPRQQPQENEVLKLKQFLENAFDY